MYRAIQLPDPWVIEQEKKRKEEERRRREEQRPQLPIPEPPPGWEPDPPKDPDKDEPGKRGVTVIHFD